MAKVRHDLKASLIRVAFNDGRRGGGRILGWGSHPLEVIKAAGRRQAAESIDTES